MRRVMCCRAAVVAAVLVALGAGCTKAGKGGTTTPSPAPSPEVASPTSTLAPSEQVAARQVLQIYSSYLQISAEASSTGQDRSADLKALLADPLRSLVLTDLQRQQEKGMMYAGQLKSNPAVGEIRLGATPPTITINDCVDASNYILVYRSNTSPVPVAGKNRRNKATTTATQYPQGWLLNKSEIISDSTC